MSFLAVASLFGHEVTISGTRFLLDGKPFPYTGISFFNAIYNPAFNRNSTDRVAWLQKFQKYGINVLRVWAQWDNKRGFVDACDTCSLYQPSGELRTNPIKVLKEVITDADRAGVVIELTLFSQESWHDGIKLGKSEADRAIQSLTKELAPYRNLTFQVWNEFSELVPEHAATIKNSDPKRVVTNSPGGGGTILGEPAQQKVLDYLSPHTSRQKLGRTWVVPPAEIAFLLARYKKPVVDDEPARNGAPNFGGPPDTTDPFDHITANLGSLEGGRLHHLPPRHVSDRKGIFFRASKWNSRSGIQRLSPDRARLYRAAPSLCSST